MPRKEAISLNLRGDGRVSSGAAEPRCGQRLHGALHQPTTTSTPLKQLKYREKKGERVSEERELLFSNK